MKQPIVAGFDGSEHGRDAIALAREFAKMLGTGLIVVYAYTPEALFWAPGTASLADEEKRRQAAAEVDAELAAFGRYEFRAVALPSAAGALEEAAEDANAQLIVVGASHHGAAGRVILGTVTQAVLDAAPCAVAVAPRGFASAAPSAFSKVGVGFDDSPQAHDALAVATDLARRAGGTLKIVWAAHLAERALPLAFAGYMAPSYFKDLRAEVEERLERAAAPLRGELSVRTEIASGETVGALVEHSSGLDLLVVGSRGYGPLKRVLLGSVSRGVVNNAGCPVLVVGRGVRSLDDPAATRAGEADAPVTAATA